MGLAVYVFEPLRVKILQMVFSPLYSRYKGRFALSNDRRKKIFNIISDKPGINYSSLKRDLGYNNGSLSHHLKYLEREGMIRARLSGIKKRYYSVDHKQTEKSTTYSERQKKILSMIGSKPGISQRELSRKLCIPPSTINYNVKKLEKEGSIVVKNRDGQSFCFLIKG